MQKLVTGGFRNFVVSGVFAFLIVLVNQSIQASTIIIDDFSLPNPDAFFVLGTGNSPTLALTQTTSPVTPSAGSAIRFSKYSDRLNRIRSSVCWGTTRASILTHFKLERMALPRRCKRCSTAAPIIRTPRRAW